MSLAEYLSGLTVSESERITVTGIESLAQFRYRTSTPPARRRLSADTEIEVGRLLQLANLADLQRVPGVGPEDAHALESAGVDSVLELGTRRADSLVAALVEDGKLSGPPEPETVGRWIGAASLLSRGVWHETPPATDSLAHRVRRRVYGSELAPFEHHVLHAAILELHGDVLLDAPAVRERIVELETLPDGCLLEVGHEYAGGEEVKLASMLTTVEPTVDDSIVWRHYVRVPTTMLSSSIGRDEWVRVERADGSPRLVKTSFAALTKLLSADELARLDTWLANEVQFEVGGQSVSTQWGEAIVREFEMAVPMGSLPVGTRLYVLRHDGEASKVVPLNRRLRVGRVAFKPVVWMERSALPPTLQEAVSVELVSSGQTMAVAVLESDGTTSLGEYGFLQAKQPIMSRQERRVTTAAGSLPAPDRMRLLRAVEEGPVPADARPSAARRGSVVIHWEYWEGTGFLNSKEIWKCVVINNSTISCEFQTKQKTSEQTELEGDIVTLTGERDAKQGELDGVEGDLSTLQSEINGYVAKVEEAESAAGQKEAEAEGVQGEIDSKQSTKGEKSGDLESLEQEQLDDETALSEEVSYLDWTEDRIGEIDDQSGDLADERGKNQDDLEDIESSLDEDSAALQAADAEVAVLEGRYDVSIVDRETWGATEHDDDPDWYDYPSAPPLSDQLDTIVVHHTADPQDQTVQKLEEKVLGDGYSEMPYHYVITEDGTIYEGREIGSMGAHAGIGTTPGVENDPDLGKIGIVVTGDFEQDWNTPLPDTPATAQLGSLKALTGNLCLEYDIDADRVLKHSEVEGRGGEPTICPGEKLAPKVETFRDELGNELPTHDSDLAAARGTAAALRQKVEDLEKQQKDKTERNEAIDEELGELSSERDDLVGEQEAHEEERDALEERMGERQGTIDDLIGEIGELESEITTLEGERDGLEAEAETLNEEARGHQSEVDDRVEQRTELRDKRDNLQSEVDALQQQIDEKQGRVDELQAEVGQAYELGDEDSQSVYEIIFDAEYQSPWELASEDLEGGQWTVEKLRAMPNEDCEVCGAHVGEEYAPDDAGIPYHPNCNCAVETLTEEVTAR